MGESLFYSWLRHVKQCHVVQTNWKVSPQWELKNVEEISTLYDSFSVLFQEENGFEIFKKNSGMNQFLHQAECDTLGICIDSNEITYYAVDVAFHENGLNYGSKDTTIMKVLAKSIRSALCLYGYLGTRKAEIIFASPKINNAILKSLESCIEQVNKVFNQMNFDFKIRLICNDTFFDVVLNPIIKLSEGIADTNELFLRAYQMYTMFATNDKPNFIKNKFRCNATDSLVSSSVAAYKEMKIGQLANIILRKQIENSQITEEELEFLQDKEYSKKKFDLQYPLLVKENTSFDPVRYYSKPLHLSTDIYYLCSQWFETSTNNDRPFLEAWIMEHEML